MLITHLLTSKKRYAILTLLIIARGSCYQNPPVPRERRGFALKMEKSFNELPYCFQNKIYKWVFAYKVLTGSKEPEKEANEFISQQGPKTRKKWESWLWFKAVKKVDKLNSNRATLPR